MKYKWYWASFLDDNGEFHTKAIGMWLLITLLLGVLVGMMFCARL